MLLSNNLVNTGAAVLGTALLVSWMGNDYRAALAATFGITLILVVFGEAIPKTIAWHRSEKVAFAAFRTSGGRRELPWPRQCGCCKE